MGMIERRTDASHCYLRTAKEHTWDGKMISLGKSSSPMKLRLKMVNEGGREGIEKDRGKKGMCWYRNDPF